MNPLALRSAAESDEHALPRFVQHAVRLDGAGERQLFGDNLAGKLGHGVEIFVENVAEDIGMLRVQLPQDRLQSSLPHVPL